MRQSAEIPIPEEHDKIEELGVEKLTVLQRLQGITYWTMEDPNEIHDFINTNLRQEWETDLKSEGRKPGNDLWLQTLSKRKWRLEVVEADRIMLDPNITNSADPKRGYIFQASLAKRRKELRTVIDTFGIVLWPLVVRQEDMTLVDGYCRLTTLREMGVSRVYAYLGNM